MRKPLLTMLVVSMFAFNAYGGETSETPESLRKVALNFEHGRDGIKQDYRQAFALYCKAALQSDADSAYSIGFMYFNGRGVPRDLALAMHWFKKAADEGDAQGRGMVVRFASVVPKKEDESCKPDEPKFESVMETNPNRQKVADWVNQIAPRYGVDPRLVMAVIQAESAFNVAALSSKNAQGLMQLIPETAERFGVKDSWNPIQNIRGGTAYLHWLLRHFEGKVDWVLAAYNAGEGAVDRYRGIPPYPETQNYVRQIQASYPSPLHPIPPEQNGKNSGG